MVLDNVNDCINLGGAVNHVILSRCRRIAEQLGVNHNTLRNCLKGRLSTDEANAEKGYLMDAESQILVDLVIKQARHGFPLNNQLVSEHANAIL